MKVLAALLAVLVIGLTGSTGWVVLLVTVFAPEDDCPPPRTITYTAPDTGTPTATPDMTTTSTGTALPEQVVGFRGQQLVNAAAVIQAGRNLGADDWTVTVGVMTAIGESTLINVDHGDRAGPDSRGIFQQRANGAWGTYQDRMTPSVAATNFFKALMRVPGYRQMTPTLAAHKTQRNADPNHYTKSWPAAVQIVAALTDNPGLVEALADSAAVGIDGTATGTDCPTGPAGAGGPSVQPAGTVGEMLRVAGSFAGVPYLWGGTTPSGFDCSGYTRYVYNKVGVHLPRVARDQQKFARTIPKDAALPGDLVFYGYPAHHVGIYAGDGMMWHAPHTGDVVSYRKVYGSPTYGRVLPETALTDATTSAPAAVSTGPAQRQLSTGVGGG